MEKVNVDPTFDITHLSISESVKGARVLGVFPLTTKTVSLLSGGVRCYLTFPPLPLRAITSPILFHLPSHSMPSLRDSTIRKLAQLSLKTDFDGATVKTRFTVMTGGERPSVKQTYQIETSRNLQLRSRSEEMIDLDTRVRQAVVKTESTLIEKKLYNPEWICRESLKQLSEDHDYFLKKTLDGTKIGILTEVEAGNPAQESFCQCVTHKVTGESLGSKGLAMVTRLKGDECISKYHVMTQPTMLVSPFISFTPNQVTTYTRYLDEANARVHALFSSGSGSHPDSTKQDQLLRALESVKKEDSAYKNLQWLTEDAVEHTEWYPIINKKVLYHPISLGSTSDSSASSTESFIWAFNDLRAAATRKVGEWPFDPEDSGARELESGL